MSRYRIPKRRVRVEVRVSNSRFLATISPASSVKEAREFVRTIRGEMPDASHHVYAFKIGYGASVSEGMSDDGEPSGTAGPPALAVLRGADIGDVVLVITRYFGGTKLGTGGLVAAYTEAAKAAFAALETEQKVTRVPFEVAVPYRLLEPVRRILSDHECVVEEEQFKAEVRLQFQIPEEGVPGLMQAIGELTAGRNVPRPVDDA
jgi:uncharacterized YigZ family protein